MKLQFQLSRWHFIGAALGVVTYLSIIIALNKLNPRPATVLFGVLLAIGMALVVANLVVSYRRKAETKKKANVWAHLLFLFFLIIAAWFFYSLYEKAQDF